MSYGSLEKRRSGVVRRRVVVVKKRTITPAIELRKTEYAERYDVKLLLSFNRFHGQIQIPTMAAM